MRARTNLFSDILVITSDASLLSQINSAFTNLAFRIQNTSSIQQSLQFISTDIPDLIVLDTAAVQQGDIRYIQTLNSELATTAIPVILLARSGEISLPNLDNAKLCISLPFDTAGLVNSVVSQINLSTATRLLVASDDERFYRALHNVCNAIHVATHHVAINELQDNRQALNRYNTLLVDLSCIDFNNLHLLKFFGPYRHSLSLQIICLLPDTAKPRLQYAIARHCDYVIRKADFGLDELLLAIVECLSTRQNNNYVNIININRFHHKAF